MAWQSFTYLIGYVGMTPQYHTINIPVFFVEPKIHPKHSGPKPQQNLMLSSRRKFSKVHKTKKVSKNYEGTGKNFNR